MEVIEKGLREVSGGDPAGAADAGAVDGAFALDLAPRGALHAECVVNGPVETNTYFVCSQDECVVIDPAWDGEKLARDFMAAHPKVRIAGLVCTHGHADHVGGVAGMRRVLGEDLPFLLSAADERIVASSIVHQKATWGNDTEDPGAPTHLLAEGDVIALGNVGLQAFATPGHTPGGMVLFAATEGGNFAFVGDTLFPGSHGRTDLEGGDEATILRSLAKMRRLLPADTLCLIGHGRATTMAEEAATNPFLR